MIFVRQLIRRIGKRIIVLESGELCLLLRRELELEKIDEGLGVVHQNTCWDLDTEYLPGF